MKGDIKFAFGYVTVIFVILLAIAPVFRFINWWFALWGFTV